MMSDDSRMPHETRGIQRREQTKKNRRQQENEEVNTVLIHPISDGNIQNYYIYLCLLLPYAIKQYIFMGEK